MVSSNPLDKLDFTSTEFRAGVDRLADKVQVRLYNTHYALLKVSFRILTFLILLTDNRAPWPPGEADCSESPGVRETWSLLQLYQVNTDLWLAKNRSRDLNTGLWLDNVCMSGPRGSRCQLLTMTSSGWISGTRMSVRRPGYSDCCTSRWGYWPLIGQK